MGSPLVGTFTMVSSANDVWGAIVGATSVYPLVMPDHYASIDVTSRDGVTAGSIRRINFGRDISRMVTRATEEITGVDHVTRTLRSKFNNDREFVGKFFTTASLVIQVDPLARRTDPHTPGSIITWTLTFTNAVGGLSLPMFLDGIRDGFEALNIHLST